MPTATTAATNAASGVIETEPTRRPIMNNDPVVPPMGSTSEDEGIVLIILIGLTAISLSLGSIFAFLNQGGRPDAPHLVLLIASVPLGWLMLHTIVAFHYAQLYYAKAASDGRKGLDAGGLEFPDTAEPTGWDFLYYSLVVGMTAQVSDVQVLTSPMRRLTLVHSVVSFFFNTVILALAVNLAAGQVR